MEMTSGAENKQSVGSSCTVLLYRVSWYLNLGSGYVVQQQSSRYSDTSYDAVLHLPETHQERHGKRQQVQLCGRHVSTRPQLNKQIHARHTSVEKN